MFLIVAAVPLTAVDGRYYAFVPFTRQRDRADPGKDTRDFPADMLRFALAQMNAIFAPAEGTVLPAVIAAFHRGVPLPVDNPPRRIPRFLVPLVHQTTRGGNARVRGQVDIPGQARHIQAIQLDRVNQVFQRARITRGPVDIGHHQRVALTTAQRSQDLLPLRPHHPEAERAVRELDTLALERRDGVLGDLPVDRAAYARDTVAQVGELVAELLARAGWTRGQARST